MEILYESFCFNGNLDPFSRSENNAPRPPREHKKSKERRKQSPVKGYAANIPTIMKGQRIVIAVKTQKNILSSLSAMLRHSS